MNEKLQQALSKSRSFQVAFRSVDTENTEKVIVEGYASTPDVDSYETKFDPAAFEESMKRYLEKNPIVLLQHKHDKPIGQVVAYSITAEGLTVRAEITEDWDGVKSAIKNRVLRGFSIGFNPVAYEFRMVGDKEIVVFTKVDIMEISVVSVPANPNSFFSLARSMEEATTEIRAARSEDTQGAAGAPETKEVAQPVQPSENDGETPAPAQAAEGGPAKEEGVKAPETDVTSVPPAADPVKDPEPVKEQETEVIKVDVAPEAQQLVDDAKAEIEAKVSQVEAENARLQSELDQAKSDAAAQADARQAAESKLAELSKELDGVRAAKSELEVRLNKSLTRGFSSGTPVNPSAQASYRMPSLVEIARSLHG